MTELDYYYQYIPEIAALIVDQQERSQEQRIQWNKDCIEYAKSLNPLLYGFIRKTLMLIDNCLKEDEGEKIVKIDDIKIYSCFVSHSPKAEKMEQKEQYFAETGFLQSQIILDRNGYLINGFTSYLLAIEHGIQIVPVRYGKRQIVRASHKPGGKMYSWELPWILIDRVHIGDRVLVRTERGVQAVTVAAVEEYAGNEPDPLRMVIRVKQTSRV
ncbi:MAG: hypothetical protein K2P42_17990 [Lachnospiraceae bacterium]|nr:hypothetical protein [Lachnospiraceae bacterium]MDE7002257.1 hypothetical protein [Lachnospiraceae bacterium]